MDYRTYRMEITGWSLILAAWWPPTRGGRRIFNYFHYLQNSSGLGNSTPWSASSRRCDHTNSHQNPAYVALFYEKSLFSTVYRRATASGTVPRAPGRRPPKVPRMRNSWFRIFNFGGGRFWHYLCHVLLVFSWIFTHFTVFRRIGVGKGGSTVS